MKTKYLSFAMLLLLLFATSSCKKDSAVIKPVQSTNSEVLTEAVPVDLISAVLKWKDNTSELKSSQSFDFTHLSMVSIIGTSGKVIIVNQIGFNASNDVNTALVFTINNDGNISDPSIIVTKTVSPILKQIECRSIDGSLHSTIELNSQTKAIKVTNSSLKSKQPLSDKILDCMEDVYRNHGWVSIWALVQSAFIPETVVALAAACAAA